MKQKVFLSIFLIFTLHITTMPAVRAENCRSAAQVTGDIYKKWGEVIIATGCVTGVTIASGGLALPATLKCIDKADKYAESVERMVSWFNTMANNGRWTIGPRRIEFGNTQTGSLVSTASRVFISAAPLDKDSVTFKVKKLDGKAKAQIIICKVTENGDFINLYEGEFDKGNDNIGQEITKTVTGVKGHLVQIRIDADSVIKKFEYQLRVTK
jgi:hypothetical protein